MSLSYSNLKLENNMQGILVFASVMATLGLQIILESMRTLVSDVSCYELIFKHIKIFIYLEG